MPLCKIIQSGWYPAKCKLFFLKSVDNKMEVTPLCTRRPKFNKLPFDEYVNNNVFLRTHLARDVERQLEQSRFESKLDFRKQKTSTHFIVDGVRVGIDFMESPTTIERFKFCCINRLELSNCRTRSSAAIELGLSRVLLHFAEDYAHGGTRKEKKTTSMRGRYNDLLGLFFEINEDVRSEMFLAFKLGMFDGLEDGRSMMQIILGKNPSGTCWFPVVEAEDGILLGQKEDHSALTLIPITVQDRTEREENYKIRLRRATREVAKLEAIMQNLLVMRLRYFLLGKRQKPVSINNSYQTETALRNRLKSTMDLLYKLGNSCGFETGQRTVKNLYFHSHEDDQTYILLEENKSKWLSIDTSQSTTCDCGSCCALCIQNRTTWVMKERWDAGLNEVSCRMKSVAEKLKENSLHVRKLFDE